MEYGYNYFFCRELLEIEHSDEKLSFKMHALVTNANYNMKKGVLLLFINRMYYKDSRFYSKTQDRNWLISQFSSFETL